MTDHASATVTAIADAVQSGATTARAAVAACLERLPACDAGINAFTARYEERALTTAETVDQRLADGDTLPLAGVPFAVKNLFDVAGTVTLAGSKINAAHDSTSRDAVLVQRLEQAGAVLVGSLNMGEYAYDFTGENAHYGACRNPWNRDHMAGGSSSGSGAALAAGAVPLTLGTDTNGSIRVPASFCGVWGLKPTYGRLPRTGAFPFCDSLDHVGPLARSVEDLARVYGVLQGHDAGDHACARNAPTPEAPVGRPLRIGIATGYFRSGEFADAEAAVALCADALASTGCELHEVSLPLVAEGRAAAFVITNVESAQLHRERLRAQADDFDPDTRDRLLAGNLLPAAWYVQAQRVRRQYARAVAAAMGDIDVLLAPATPFAAPRVGQKTVTLGGETVGLRANIGYFTQPISCIGLPVVAAPVHDPARLPLAVQLIGQPWHEAACLAAGALLQDAGVCVSDVAPGSN